MLQLQARNGLPNLALRERIEEPQLARVVARRSVAKQSGGNHLQNANIARDPIG